MDILIVHPCKGFYGGAEEVVVQLERHLLIQHHDIRVISKDPPSRFPSAFRTYSWPQFRREVHWHLEWADVICCFNFPATLAVFPMTKKPVVWYCNEPPELFTNWKRKPIEAFNRWWVRKSNMKCVVATDFDAKRFENIYHVKPTIIPYGIDGQFWSQGWREPKVEGPIRLLQVGTLTPLKNQEASIRLLLQLLDMKVEATLTLVGSIDADYNYFHHLAKLYHTHMGLYQLTFAGQRTQEEIRDAYYSHDILLHPVKGQGGWLVPFEAACTGMKVIVSKEFQVADFFGCWIEDFDSVMRYIEMSVEEISMCQPTPTWIKENLTWEKFGGSMLKVLERVVREDKT